MKGSRSVLSAQKRRSQIYSRLSLMATTWLTVVWGIEGDSEAFCETCHRPLDNSFTDYAAEQMLNYFDETGFDINCPSHCHALLECTYALGSGNEELQQRLENLARTVLGVA
jgi:hypothetical protein